MKLTSHIHGFARPVAGAVTRHLLLTLVLLTMLLGPASPVLAAEDPPEYLYGWGTAGTGAGEFNEPRGVALDDDGNVYVVDSANDRVQKFNQCGDFIAEFGSSGTGTDQFILPFDVVVDSSGDVWVSDYSNHCVKKFHDAGGNVYGCVLTIGTPGTSGTGDGVFNHPWGLAVDDEDNLYVADCDNHRIQKFSSSGDFITKWGIADSNDASAGGRFENPTEVTVDSSGNVYVADNNNYRIQKFVWDPALGDEGEYEFVVKWTVSSGGLYGLAVDLHGNVYVTDHENDLTRKYDGSGTLLSMWGDSGSCDSCLDQPFGIAVNDDGDVYVADLGNNRIQVFGETQPWMTFLGSAAGEEGHDTAVDGCGNVYVVGDSYAEWGVGEGTVSENPVRAFTSNGDAYVAKVNRHGELQWNTFLGGSGYDHGFGIAVDNDGNVYVTGWSDGSWGTPVRPHQGYDDAFACQLNSNGELQWLTFLGSGGDGSGSGADYGYVIRAGANGGVYVGGESDYTWQGTSAPVRPHTAGNYDGFVAGLNASGVLQWNTFLGAAGGDNVQDIALDGSSNLYVAGTSPASWQGTSAPTRTHSGGYDGFAAMLNSSGALQWNTFLGGAGSDSAHGIARNGDGNLLLAGSSSATWQGDSAPVLSYSFGLDAFAAMLDSSGALQWNTFLGGDSSDQGYDAVADGTGNWYVAGYSEGTWDTTLKEFQGGYDAFAVKLNPGGTLQWSTFIGGSSYDFGYAIAADYAGNTCIVGKSMAEWGLPIRAYSAGYDAFAVKLDSEGTATLETVAIDLALKAGWNMVSVPVVPEDTSRAAVFPPADVVAVYTWNPSQKSYEVPDTIEPEVGYWVAVATDRTITVTGTPVTEWDSSLTTGWNMVGSVCGDPVLVTDLVDDPTPSIVRSAIYSWNPTNKSYATASQIAEGLGYWVATTQNCTLAMTAPV